MATLTRSTQNKSEEERAKALATHAGLVRAHMNQLAKREYWEHGGPELELVVLFLSG